MYHLSRAEQTLRQGPRRRNQIGPESRLRYHEAQKWTKVQVFTSKGARVPKLAAQKP